VLRSAVDQMPWTLLEATLNAVPKRTLVRAAQLTARPAQPRIYLAIDVNPNMA
jgi:hypothetical protein